jgi:hypothetical protein
VKKPKKEKKKPDLRFDFATIPGPMCLLVNEAKQSIRLASWPQSLLDAYWAGHLRGRAETYAVEITQTRIEEIDKLGNITPYDVCEVSPEEGDNGLRGRPDETERTVPMV